MKIWRKLARKVGLGREATPLEILQAHLGALLADPLANPEPLPRKSLPLANAEGPRCLAIELGLSRIEVYVDGPDRVRLETSGDALILGSIPVDACRAQLEQLKLNFDDKFGALVGHFSVASRVDRKNTCRSIEQLLVGLLETESGRYYSVAIERRRLPDNTALIDQIKQLVKLRDIESRRLVYQSIVQGLFFLPVHPAQAPHSPPEPKLHEPLGESAVWTIYSDLESLPKGESSPYILISGVRLIQAAHVHNLGGIQLNPGARFGGELHQHELQSVGDYLRTLGMMDLPSAAPKALN